MAGKSVLAMAAVKVAMKEANMAVQLVAAKVARRAAKT